MSRRPIIITAACLLAAACHAPTSDVGANIAAAHDNAADALDNRADALHQQAKQTRAWGKDLKTAADKAQKDGARPDQATLNQM